MEADRQRPVHAESSSRSSDSHETVSYPCISARQPYAGEQMNPIC